MVYLTRITNPVSILSPLCMPGCFAACSAPGESSTEFSLERTSLLLALGHANLQGRRGRGKQFSRHPAGEFSVRAEGTSTNQLQGYKYARKSHVCVSSLSDESAQMHDCPIWMQEVPGSTPDDAILVESSQMGQGTILKDHEDFPFHS